METVQGLGRTWRAEQGPQHPGRPVLTGKALTSVLPRHAGSLLDPRPPYSPGVTSAQHGEHGDTGAGVTETEEDRGTTVSKSAGASIHQL